MAHEVVLAFAPGGGLDGLDSAGAQREPLVRDHQPPVDADHAAEAAAGLAGAHRRVEGEHRGDGLGVAQVALGAVQAGGELPRQGCLRFFRRQRIRRQPAAAALERQLDRLDHPRPLGAAEPEAVGHHVQHLLAALGALRLHAGEAGRRQPLLDVFRRGAGRQLHGEGQDHARVAGCGGPGDQFDIDAVGRIVAHRQRGLAVEQLAGAGEQELEVVVQLRHGADRGARAAHRVGLVDGDGRRHALHPVHRRLVHAVEKLPRVSAEGFHVAPLAFGVERVEHQAGLARAAGAGDHRHLAGADVQVQVLEVVLAGAADADGVLGHRYGAGERVVRAGAEHSRKSGGG